MREKILRTKIWSFWLIVAVAYDVNLFVKWATNAESVIKVSSTRATWMNIRGFTLDKNLIAIFVPVSSQMPVIYVGIFAANIPIGWAIWRKWLKVNQVKVWKEIERYKIHGMRVIIQLLAFQKWPKLLATLRSILQYLQYIIWFVRVACDFWKKAKQMLILNSTTKVRFESLILIFLYICEVI